MSATCKVKKTECAYSPILTLYGRAVKDFLAGQSTVVERRKDPSSSSVVMESDPPGRFAKSRYKTERTCQQYLSSKAKFQRNNCSRRAFGGGRQRTCSTVREMLALWYSIIRHSVNVEMMCRFPNKVLLVKAQMLLDDYYTSCMKNKVDPEQAETHRSLAQ